MSGDVRASFNMESFSGVLLATVLLCAALLEIRLLYRDVRSGVLSLTKLVHVNPLLLQFSHALVTCGLSGVRKWIDTFELLIREIVKVVQDFVSSLDPELFPELLTNPISGRECITILLDGNTQSSFARQMLCRSLVKLLHYPNELSMPT